MKPFTTIAVAIVSLWQSFICFGFLKVGRSMDASVRGSMRRLALRRPMNETAFRPLGEP